MPAELVERIDAALADGVSRGEFVRRAVEQALSEAKEPEHPMQAGPGSVPSSGGVRPAAPAEQPETRQVIERVLGPVGLGLVSTPSRRGGGHLPGCKCPVCK